MPEACALPARDALPAEGTVVAETANVEYTTNATDRLIMYDATLHLVVPHIESALNAIKAIASTQGGYMQSLTSSSIIVRIPQPRLNETMLAAEKLGIVTSREIQGDDVTEEMMDLHIRLKNLEETRAKLARLLDRADKVEDVLAVEKELQRVTENLELLKGRIKFLSHGVQYATLTTHLNSPVQQQEISEVVPFAWIRELASEIAPDPSRTFCPGRRSRPWLKMTFPADWVKVYDYKGITRAMSGTGVMLLVRQNDNFEGGTLDFWAPLLRRGLTAEKVISLDITEKTSLDNGAPALRFTGTRELGRKTYRYLLWVVVTPRYIYTVECWGPAQELASLQAQVETACRSMGIKP